jgi:hypothetical protein
VVRLTSLAAFVALVGFALAGTAAAFTCPTVPLADRLEAADGAFVGNLLSARTAPPVGGVPREVLRYKIKVEVKGSLGPSVEVVSVSGPKGLEQVYDTDAGILMTRANGTWVSSVCGQTSPAALLAEADEPKGAAIKVALGIVIVALVLVYSIRRMRRGTRPDIPGAPVP